MRSQLTTTVLVPTFNRRDLLVECIDSLLQQSLPPIQILIINDGSTDGTAEIVGSFPEPVEYVEQENAGKSAAMNRGLNRSRGDLIWVLDDDDLAFPDAVERFTYTMEAHPDVGLSYCGYFWFRGGPGEPRRIQGDAVIPAFAEGEILTRMLEWNSLPGPTMCVRRACYEAVGPFDTALYRSQDYEMALRLLRSYRSVSLGATAYYRRLHEGERGPGEARHEADQIVQKWLEYDQLIFRRLRDQMELREYLPFAIQPDSPRLRRRALLQRAKVMALKGLGDDMLTDLRAAFALMDEPLEDEDSLILSTLVMHPQGRRTFLAAPDVWSAIGSGSAIVVRAVHRALLRGLYWTCHRGVIHRDLDRIKSAIPGLLRVLGPLSRSV